MPYINVKLNLAEDVKLRDQIVKVVLENTTHILGKNEDVTSVLVEFVPQNAWSVGGKNVPTFYLDIKITKGTNTKVQKADYIQAIYKEFETLLGKIDQASYVLIHEIDADAWGFEGITQERRFIQP